MVATAVLLAAPVQARDLPSPPSAADFARATARVLSEPGFRSPLRVRDRFGGSSGGSGTATVPLPGAGALFPANRILAIYGAPQLKSTALGKRRPRAAARLAVAQAKPYADLGERPVIPSFDLIGVVANSTAGTDRLYRTRQPATLIDQYLKQARAMGGRLMIDIQPGRSPVLDELDAMAPWIGQPDVDVAIDPEWNVGPRGIPGRTAGSITARDVNLASRRVQAIVDEGDLPPKVMVVHQFSRSSIRRRSRIKQRPGVEVTLNFDGIGAPAPKIAGYRDLAVAGLSNGFSLFYDLDTPLMKPGAVLALDPVVDFLLYQ